MRNLIHTYASITFVSVFLTACGGSGEPTSSDIETALKVAAEEHGRRLKDAAGNTGFDDMFKIEIHAVKKIGCSAAEGGKGYSCDVEMDRTLPWPAGRTKDVTSIRFVQTDEGWRAVE